MFGKPSISQEHAKLIKAMETGPRRPAQHIRPSSVTDSGFASFGTPDAQAIFIEFDYFGATLNHHIADPWTVEETAETLIKTLHLGSPSLGRTYQVFYNGVRMGKLQVTAGFHPNGLREDVEWHRQNRAAIVLIELDWMRFVPYNHALSLVSTIEWFVGPYEEGKGDVARKAADLHAAAKLSGYLWEAIRYDDLVAGFQTRIDGPYDLLKLSTDHWKEGGVDPFERWGGDRPN